MHWCVLEGGLAVGFNENPSVGWSFPIVRRESYVAAVKERALI